jgi:transcription antitermination factor NusG
MNCTGNLLSSLALAPDSSLIDPPRWYAVYTYPRHEKSVLEHFESKSLEAFLPTFVTESRWKDRRVRLQTPIFPGYVFTRINASSRNKVLSSPGVIRMLCFNGMPAPIDDAEIESVKLCLKLGMVLGPCPVFEVGDRVRVKSGVLEGLEGHISRCKNDRRLIIPITLIHQSVAIEINVQLLELVNAEADGRGRSLRSRGSD